MRQCSIEECDKKHEAKGYCKRHYRSFHKYGDPLYIENNKGNRKSSTNKRKFKVPYEDNHKFANGIEYKLCSDCNEWFPMTEEYFYKNKSSPDGFNPYCKECTKQKTKKWQDENYEIYQKGFNKRARRRREDPLKLEYHRQKANEQRESGYYKEWQINNKDKTKEYNQYKTMHKTHKISDEEWMACKEYFNNECAYCGLYFSEHFNMYRNELVHTDFHKEHVDHEGTNGIGNCVPSCKSCNSKKWKYNFEDWYKPNNEVYDLHRYERIMKWLNEDHIEIKENN